MLTFTKDGSSMVFHRVWAERFKKMEPFTTAPSDLVLKMVPVKKILRSQIAKSKTKEFHKKENLPLEFIKQIEFLKKGQLKILN